MKMDAEKALCAVLRSLLDGQLLAGGLDPNSAWLLWVECYKEQGVHKYAHVRIPLIVVHGFPRGWVLSTGTLGELGHMYDIFKHGQVMVSYDSVHAPSANCGIPAFFKMVESGMGGVGAGVMCCELLGLQRLVLAEPEAAHALYDSLLYDVANAGAGRFVVNVSNDCLSLSRAE